MRNDVLFNLVLVSVEKKYQPRETVFHHIFKQLEFRKNCALACRIFKLFSLKICRWSSVCYIPSSFFPFRSFRRFSFFPSYPSIFHFIPHLHVFVSSPSPQFRQFLIVPLVSFHSVSFLFNCLYRFLVFFFRLFFNFPFSLAAAKSMIFVRKISETGTSAVLIHLICRTSLSTMNLPTLVVSIFYEQCS